MKYLYRREVQETGKVVTVFRDQSGGTVLGRAISLLGAGIGVGEARWVSEQPTLDSPVLHILSASHGYLFMYLHMAQEVTAVSQRSPRNRT